MNRDKSYRKMKKRINIGCDNFLKPKLFVRGIGEANAKSQNHGKYMVMFTLGMLLGILKKKETSQEKGFLPYVER